MAITIQLPTDLEEHLSRQWTDVPRRALEALVVEGYREGLLSHSRIGEILSLGASETDALLLQHNALFAGDDDDLGDDLDASRQLMTQ